ncbi:MAG: 3' terminal RNA ribose 2'-O-methyltransferase Hen1 [Firmicutes bacterium]|nr:3' terminal RNA ribose 2'-O-methyltransferase Hen1 [Bacillota bacterium]
MLLKITYKGENATNLGFLLYKNPYRPQAFQLSHGRAFVFYPEISENRTTAALLLDINPIDLARGNNGGLFDYVNDRPYCSSSLMSTAISKVFGTALGGRADDFQALADSPLNLTATVTMLPCPNIAKLAAIFEPLKYFVSYETFSADEKFSEWGNSKYVNLTISAKVRLRDLLKHLYVLIPVFDRQKHYWVGEDEVKKLLKHGEGWLTEHPEKGYIMAQYLNRQRKLINLATEMLGEEIVEKPAINLNIERLSDIVLALKNCGATKILDLGCGEGKLLELLVKEPQFKQITGVDVSFSALQRATKRLDRLHFSETVAKKVQLLHGSLMYKDDRFSGFDAACVVEVIEHLDLARLAAFERVLFQLAKPPTIIITTPNKEYNDNYNLGEDFRHDDHRFEWTRAEFKKWATQTAEKFSYSVAFSEIGAADEKHGAPTQMGVFSYEN